MLCFWALLSLDVNQMALSTAFNSKDTIVVVEGLWKQLSCGGLRHISKNKDDPYSFGRLIASSEDVIDEKKFGKVVQGGVEDTLLHPSQKIQGQNDSDAIVSKMSSTPSTCLVSKQVKLLHPM